MRNLSNYYRYIHGKAIYVKSNGDMYLVNKLSDLKPNDYKIYDLAKDMSDYGCLKEIVYMIELALAETFKDIKEYDHKYKLPKYNIVRNNNTNNKRLTEMRLDRYALSW